jgi:hypothetical protein
MMTVGTCVTSPNSRKWSPFVVMMIPHVQMGDNTASVIVSHAVSELKSKWNSPLHWVFDAGFGAISAIEEIQNSGGFVPCSVSQNQLGELWQALSLFQQTTGGQQQKMELWQVVML